ncbi:MAG TPA: exosortase E/protease, VPEID-CTERM system, partial [Acidobacteriaceae bacterium]
LESAAAAAGYEPAALSPVLLFILRIALTGAAVLLLALACIPREQWIAIRRATGYLWLYALLAGAFACLLRSPLQSLWSAQNFAPGAWLQSVTFACVSRLLTPLISGLEVDAPGFVLSAPNFAIYVAPECSGLEGLGLVLVFTLVWLIWFRREFRFPQALLLIPMALLAVWALNVLRIAALMLIGNSISPEIAINGFHSQAGWIAFTLVALAFSIAARHIPWIRHPLTQQSPASPSNPVGSSESAGESPATPAYLIPFLAILAASFLSRAASGNFETLYPLRFFAAFFALYGFRRSYRSLNFRLGWLAPFCGIAVSLLWIIPSALHHTADSAIPSGLAQLSPVARSFWILFRVLAATITVSIAEELAFRGFLARRLVGRDFDNISYRALTFVPVLISSAAFGLMHGSHWLAGTAAGIIFALLARYRNRLGDAIIAHAAANLFLAAWVLLRADYSLW